MTANKLSTDRWILICKLGNRVLAIQQGDEIKVYKSFKAAEKVALTLCAAAEVLAINIETGQIEVL
jgi:hypothetical protein